MSGNNCLLTHSLHAGVEEAVLGGWEQMVMSGSFLRTPLRLVSLLSFGKAEVEDTCACGLVSSLRCVVRQKHCFSTPSWEHCILTGGHWRVSGRDCDRW